MGNAFVNGAYNEANKTLTENGANAYKSTGSALVDLFGCIGSIRGRDPREVETKFFNAFREDPLLATKMAFYARNIRGGLGERETFRRILRYMAVNMPDVLNKNVYLIPLYGRWDDLYALVGTPLENEIWSVFTAQLSQDIENYKAGKPISILAKWLKSVNTSSRASRALGTLTAKKMGLSEKEYRVVLSVLRDYLNVIEAKMSNGEWKDITFDHVPSRAMSIYKNAFRKHLPEEFSAYMAKVQSGEKKINSATLYPYDILEKMRFGGGFNSTFSCQEDPVLEAQWKALPNYVIEPTNFLIMADTSGSMIGRPMATSIGLAIYFAERNFGAFKDLFLTFSSRPRFVRLDGDTLASKIRKIESIVSNTNLEAAFELVLNTAINNNVPAADMPRALVVISDGEIDYFSYDVRAWGFFDQMEKRFKANGYEMPNVVMWNVASRGDRFLAKVDNPKIQFISGSSPSAFKSLIKGQNLTSFEIMVETLSDPMYDPISI